MGQFSSKWWVSTGVIVATAGVTVIADAQANGVELPTWVAAVGAVLSPVLVWWKNENRPSPSAVTAATAGAG